MEYSFYNDKDINIIKNMIKQNLNIINEKDKNNKTILEYALMNSNNDLIDYILSLNNLDINYKNNDKNNYLHLSIINQNYSCMKKLISKGIDLNAQNKDGNTPLHLAYKYGNLEIIHLLINNFINFTIKNNKGKIPEEVSPEKIDNKIKNDDKYIIDRIYLKSNKKVINKYNNKRKFNIINENKFNNSKEINNEKIIFNSPYSHKTVNTKSPKIFKKTIIMNTKTNIKPKANNCFYQTKKQNNVVGTNTSIKMGKFIMSEDYIENQESKDLFNIKRLNKYKTETKNETNSKIYSEDNIKLNNNNKYINYKNNGDYMSGTTNKIEINSFKLNRDFLSGKNLLVNKIEDIYSSKNISNIKTNIEISNDFQTDSNNFYVSNNPDPKIINRREKRHNSVTGGINVFNSDSQLIKFLDSINMNKYFNNLKQNGFDDIYLLINQTQKGLYLKDQDLKDCNILVPGDRARILIKIYEKANFFGFELPKNVFYIPKNLNEISDDINIQKLNIWLKEINCQNYLINFIINGYYTLELFQIQFYINNPLPNILMKEIGIEKIGHISKILYKLNQDCLKFKALLTQNNFTIELKDESKCNCFIF